MSTWVKVVSGVSGPGAVSTSSIPTIPNEIEAQINTRVAIFCIISVYQSGYKMEYSRLLVLVFCPATVIGPYRFVGCRVV